MDYVGIQFDEHQIAEAKTLWVARWLRDQLEEIIELEGSVALEYYASLIVSELSELRPDDEPFVVVQRKPEA